MVGQDVNLDNMKGMQLKHEADDAFVEAGENADFGKDSKGLLDGFNMSEFNEDREKQAGLEVAKLEAGESVGGEIDWGDAFEDNASGNGADTALIGGEIEDTLGSEEQVEGSIEKEKQIPSGEYNALFEKFLVEGHITPDDLVLLQEAQITSDNYTTIIPSLGISSEAQTEIISSISHLNNPERIEEAKGELHEEFPDVFRDYFTKQDGAITWNSTFHGEAFEKVAQHYMGGETKTPEDRVEDLSMALTMAAEDLGQRAQVSLNSSNTEFFNQNLKRAKDPSLSEKERFDSIANISQIVNKVEGIKGKTDKMKIMKISGENKLKEARRYEDFQKHLEQLNTARNEQNQEKILVHTDSLKQIAQEAGLTDGEATALIGGEDDILSDDITEDTKI